MKNKTFLILGSVIGLVILICLCGLILASLAPQTPPPADQAAVIPTPTVVPPPSPTPGPTPLPTSTVPPPPTPTSPAPLGITRASLKGVYEDLGFTFEDSTPVDGQPRIMGQSSTAYVELIGPPDNLTQASIMFAASQNKNENMANIVYSAALLNGAVSEWDGGAAWLTSALTHIAEAGQLSTTHQNKSITLTAHKELGLIILTVKGIP